MKLMKNEPVALNEAALQEAFPAVDPGAKPVGGRILVQWRQTKKTVTSSGIVLIEETKETEKWNNQVAKVVALGPLAFKKRDSLEPWPEGNWIEIDDFVRMPKWGGDRWEVPYGDPGLGEVALFSVFNDHEVIAKVTGDPLTVKAFV
jgi:co-chaperonin GroES (HSP10)